jgi:hypothetical protein
MNYLRVTIPADIDNLVVFALAHGNVVLAVNDSPEPDVADRVLPVVGAGALFAVILKGFAFFGTAVAEPLLY